MVLPRTSAGYVEVGSVVDENGVDIGPLLAWRMNDFHLAEARFVTSASGRADYVEGTVNLRRPPLDGRSTRASVDAKLIVRHPDNSSSAFDVTDRAGIAFSSVGTLGLHVLDGLAYGTAIELLRLNGGKAASPPAELASPVPAATPAPAASAAATPVLAASATAPSPPPPAPPGPPPAPPAPAPAKPAASAPPPRPHAAPSPSAAPASAKGSCAMDTDCSGDRVCENGHCVAPSK
jgi:hypothetical protein